MSIAPARKPDHVYRKRVVRRLAKLLVLCHTRRVLPSLAALAAELQCCERTVRRDLEALEEAYIAIPPRLDERLPDEFKLRLRRVFVYEQEQEGKEATAER